MEIIDYAKPTILAEKALKDMHNAMLERRYEDALGFALDVSYKMCDVMHAIRVEQERARKTSTRS
jgi:hypothetical protein